MNIEEHITVETEDQEEFINFCNNNNIKTVLIKLDSGEYPNQLMTSNDITKEEFDTKSKSYKLIEEAGFDIVRHKIEVCPKTFNPDDFDYLYFESHIRVITKDKNDEDSLDIADQILNVHKSKNAFKKFDDGSKQTMLTYRSYDEDIFNNLVCLGGIINVLNNLAISYDKIEKEICVKDTKVGLDKGWI